jgi:hypothetical protein
MVLNMSKKKTKGHNHSTHMSSKITRQRRQEEKSFATCGSQLIVSFATILSCKIVANNKKLQKTFLFFLIYKFC